MKLTPNQFEVLNYLNGWHYSSEGLGKFVSPTKIGLDLGHKPYGSPWASPICKQLVELGLAERSDEPGSKGRYKITPTGLEKFAELL